MTMLSQAISVLEDNLDIRIECIEKYCRHSVAYQKNAADTLPVICILKFSLHITQLQRSLCKCSQTNSPTR